METTAQEIDNITAPVFKTTDAQRRAQTAYYQRNKAKVMDKNRIRSNERYATDEEFRAHRIEIAKKQAKRNYEKVKFANIIIAKMNELKTQTY